MSEETNSSKYADPLVSVRGVYKSFAGVHALKNVYLDLEPGEVHALVGGNGAGKSTLVKILSGIYQPEQGEVFLRGEPIKLSNPRIARNYGFATIHQDLSLVNQLDVAANLFLGREIMAKSFLSFLSFINAKEMQKKAEYEFKRLGINIPSVKASVAMMSGGQRQAIACARALLDDNPALLIMDEPTAALGVKESAEVIELMKRCCDEGSAILLISHDMQEVFNCSDKITVMRLGRIVTTVYTKDITPNYIVGLITSAIEVADKGIEQ